MDDGSNPVNDAIGIYIAVASFYFVVVFCADIFNRYIKGKPWYPTKYISLNAISLTALAIAIKIPTDLTTPMSEPAEQLSKITGSILVFTVMANIMPSLGAMDGTSIFSNVGALIIVVVTLIVDLGIQLKTDIINGFLTVKMIIVAVIMFLQLLLVISTSVAVPTTKELMERQFKAKHNLQYHAENTMKEDNGEKYVEKMKETIVKCWFMACTSNPQYVVARSPTCIVSGTLSIITVGVFIRIIAKAQYYHYAVADQKSGYHISIVISIVFIQIFAIILGTIGPASRCMWCSEMFFKNCKLIFYSTGGYFKVEEYWVSSLVKWKEAPLRVNFKGILIRKIIRFFKWCVLTVLIAVQMVIIIISKFIRALSVVPMLLLHKILQVLLHRYFFHPAATIVIVIYLVRKEYVEIFYLFIACFPYIVLFLMRSYLTSLKRIFQLDRLPIIMDEQQQLISDNYILHLEGETGLVGFITGEDHKSQRNNKNRKREKNALLVRLIQHKSTLMEGFKFVTAFGGTKKSFSHPDLLRRSWALPLVTLSCVAVTLQGVDRKQVQLLLEGVKRGLKFVNLIEQSFDDKSLVNMREAAEFVWLGIDLDHRWFDYHFPSKSRHSRNEDAREVVEELKRIATNHVLEFKNRAGEDACINRPYEWPPKVLAADCMHTVCSTILQNHSRYETNTMLFHWLEIMISDILGACLTNLPEVIHVECSKKSIEVREEGVWNAANLFVDTEDLLVLLYDPVVVSKFPERKKHIEEWQSGDEDLSLNSEPSVAQLDGVLMDVVVVRG